MAVQNLEILLSKINSFDCNCAALSSLWLDFDNRLTKERSQAWKPLMRIGSWRK